MSSTKKEGAATSRTAMEVIRMALDTQAPEEYNKKNFPELTQFVYWVRQIVALIVAVVFGVLPLTGGTAISLYLALDVGLVYLYINFGVPIQVAEADSQEDRESFTVSELVQDGFTASIGTFLLVWVTTFNVMGFSAA